MAAESPSPYPGLRPYDQVDHGLFFGREEQTRQLLDRLAHTRFLMVAGTSGCGKSSLVRAGLLPALQAVSKGSPGTQWKVAVMRPGASPLASLAQALEATSGSPEPGHDSLSTREEALRASSLGLIDVATQELLEGENLLVVVDQFEELFRYRHSGPDYDSERLFVRLLLEAAHSEAMRIYVVATMRADFVGDCASQPGLAEVLNRALYVVPRMNRTELRQAIEGPVARAGGEIAPRLVQRLLNDVGNDPDALPMLQHSLQRTWDVCVQGGDPVLDLKHYELVGTLARALSLHADEIYESFQEAHRRIAHRLFQVLTELGPDNRVYRRPARLRDVSAIADCATEEVVLVAEAFRRPGAGFLMPPWGFPLTPDTVLDISHESFARRWDRLHLWIAEEAESKNVYLRLRETAKLHAQGMASLYRDPELSIARRWLERTRPNAVWAQRYGGQFSEVKAFLDTSIRGAGRHHWFNLTVLLIANLIVLLALLRILLMGR